MTPLMILPVWSLKDLFSNAPVTSAAVRLIHRKPRRAGTANSAIITPVRITAPQASVMALLQDGWRTAR
jgi:hypothetical protein